MRADGCNYAPRLGKREFPSITLSAVSCCIFSANPETSGRFPAKRSKLLRLLTTFSARGCRFRREWRLRSALIWKCADRGPAGDFRPCSSRPRSQQVRRSSPAAGSRAHKYPYPPKSSPLFGPAQGVGRERIFRARQPPKLREPRFRWLLDVVRLSRDRDRQTEI